MASADDVALLADIVLASGAAAAGVVDPGLGVVAAGTAVGLSHRIRLALERRAARNFLAATEGVRSSGIEVRPAIEALLLSDEGMSLVESTVARIAAASFAEKAHALGTCIGRAGLSPDEADVEAQAVWAQLIDRLQRRHVLALTALKEPVVQLTHPESIRASDHLTIERESKRGASLQLALDSYSSMTSAALKADLVGWGLIHSVQGVDLGLRGGAGESDTFWLPTALGTDVTNRLERDAGVVNHGDRSEAPAP